MTRSQLITTASVIAAIIAFTVAVKIIASNSEAPKIDLPEGALVAPSGGAPDVRLTGSAPAAPTPTTIANVPTTNSNEPGVAQAPAPAPAPVAVVEPGDAGARRVTSLAGPTSTIPTVIGVAPAASTATADVVVQQQTQPATPETDRREALEQERREQANGAVSALMAVQRQLNSGDTAGVDQALANASASMNAVGQASLQQARNAIANKDLTGAAILINQAVATASTTPAAQ